MRSECEKSIFGHRSLNLTQFNNNHTWTGKVMGIFVAIRTLGGKVTVASKPIFTFFLRVSHLERTLTTFLND